MNFCVYVNYDVSKSYVNYDARKSHVNYDSRRLHVNKLWGLNIVCELSFSEVVCGCLMWTFMIENICKLWFLKFICKLRFSSVVRELCCSKTYVNCDALKLYMNFHSRTFSKLVHKLICPMFQCELLCLKICINYDAPK